MLATFRHFCSSPHVLRAYASSPHSEANLCEHIRQGMQLSLRGEQTRTPDHMHRQRVQHFLRDSSCLTDMLLQSLGVRPVFDTHISPLHVRGEHVYVQQAHLEDWYNEVVTYQSSVPHIAAAWVRYAHEQHHNQEFMVQKTLNSLQYASLPSIYENRFNDLMQNTDEGKGKLCDLHTHFNGSTEFTSLWLHSLEHPYIIYKCLQDAHGSINNNSKTQYFYRQLNTSPLEVFNNLLKATKIRHYICHCLGEWEGSTLVQSGNACCITHQDVAGLLYRPQKDECISRAHPFKHNHLARDTSLLQHEAAMWVYIIRGLHKRKNFAFAQLVHMYLLLMNLYARLLVHQQDQFGFDQFQYVTCTKAYDPLEESNSAQRFAQFHGMYGPDLAHIEARFSPKDTVQKTVALIQSIWRGYEEHHKAPEGSVTPCASCPKIAAQYRMHKGTPIPVHKPPRKSHMSLSLVAHFIKAEDTGNGLFRHHQLRTSLEQKARAFAQARDYLYKTAPHMAKALVGKDAAGNEMDTPPEVFAPIFRFLHHKGLCNTTYHAGEDFEHILSGIRAVHEAMTFLSLGSGDRIGHATALGIAPHKCSSNPIFCARGHWLDNLVWLTRQIHLSPRLANYQGLSFRFKQEIARYYSTIYTQDCPSLPVLWQAWEIRHLDIRLAGATLTPLDAYTQSEMEKLKEAKEKCADAFKEWQKYHVQCHRKKWHEKIKIEEPALNDEFLCALQDSVLDEMREKNIIVEALPSSNVRISHYTSTDEHHILRWLDPADTRPAPHVVLGTDDPGIFATNLRNEYALLFHMLCKKYASDDEKPYQIIRHLIENSRSHRFQC